MKKNNDPRIFNIAVLGDDSDMKLQFASDILSFRQQEKETLSHYSDIEKQRNSTIFNTVISKQQDDHKFNFLITADHTDFRNSISTAINVADAIILCGSLSQPSKFLCDRIHNSEIPVFSISDEEVENTDFTNSNLNTFLEAELFPLNIDKGKGILPDLFDTENDKFQADNALSQQRTAIEKIVTKSDETMLRYMEGEEVSRNQFISLFQMAIYDHTVSPYMSIKEKADLNSLFSLFIFLLKANNNTSQSPNATIFQTVRLPSEKTFHFLKANSSDLTSNETLFIQRNRKEISVNQLYTIQNQEIVPVEEAYRKSGTTCKAKALQSTNDIILLPYQEALNTYDTITSDPQSDVKDASLKTEWNNLFILQLLDPEEENSEEFSEAIQLMRAEFPNVEMKRDHDIDQMEIEFTGKTQADFIQRRLKSFFNIKFQLLQIELKHREKISHSVETHQLIQSDSGKGGQYAEIVMLVEPYQEKAQPHREYEWENTDELPWNGTMQFYWCVKSHKISTYHVKPIKQGIIDTLKSGFRTDFPIENLTVYILDGSMHKTDTTQLAFEIAAGKAMKKALNKAGTDILYPFQNITIEFPLELTDTIFPIIENQNATILSTINDDSSQRLELSIYLDHRNSFLQEIFQVCNGNVSIEFGEENYR